MTSVWLLCDPGDLAVAERLGAELFQQGRHGGGDGACPAQALWVECAAE